MPSNLLLLLPLLGGYLFIHLCHRFFFRAQALDGHRLIFEAAVAGFILFLPCRLVTALLFLHAPELRELWYAVAGRVHFLSTLVMTLLLAPVAAWIWNLFEGVAALRETDNQEGEVSSLLIASRDRALAWAVGKWGNNLHVLLHEAAKRAAAGESALVCLTMKDRKAFVGWITNSPNLRANDTYVTLAPVVSGYRDKDTMSLSLSVIYPVDEYEEASAEEKFVIALPVAEITSARFFDLDLYYEVFAKQQRQAATSQGVPALANPS